jgi:hypothetical protein
MKPVLHLGVNGLLLIVGYYWLGVPESRAGTLAWSITLALFILLLGSWAYTASFLYRAEPSLVSAWQTSLRNIFPVLLTAAGIALLYWLLAAWAGYSIKPAFRIASWLTLKLRTPVRPASIERIFNTVVWIVRWVVLPVLFLPVLSAVSTLGWRGFGAGWRKRRSWVFWIETPVLLLLAVRVPLMLVNWVPRVDGFGVQSASFAMRAAVAYLLFGGAWLVLAFITSEGNPRAAQPSTVVSP